MNKRYKNLPLFISAGALLVVMAILVPVLQYRQEMRQRAAGRENATSKLPTQAWRNPSYPTSAANQTPPQLTITLPPEGKRYQAPNDTIPPQVTITNPQSGSTVPANSLITIQATATDNIGVAKVEFLVNGQTICIDTTAPYSCTWQVPFQSNTQYLLITRAYDATGNVDSKTSIVRTR